MSTKRPDKNTESGALDRTQAFDRALAIAGKARKHVDEYSNREILELLHRVDSDAATAEDRAELQHVLGQHPTLWRACGDMADLAVARMIGDIKGNPTMRESLKAGVEHIRRDLGYGAASSLEQLLIEQVAVCWLNTSIVEYQYARALAGTFTLAHGDYWERRLTTAQTRHLRALETLARVRRLLRPVPMQVNIAGAGGQQVNMVQPAPDGA